MRSNARRLLAAFVIVLLTCGLATAQAPGAAARPAFTSWSDYGGSASSMQYSALSQITAGNVARLQRVWFHQVPGDEIRLVFNPLVVDDVMYVAGEEMRVTALNARTGELIWFAAEPWANERGIAYWESPDRQDRRLIMATDGMLRQIDARTGQPVATFGENGSLDLRTITPGRERALAGPSRTPPRIFENLAIVGSNPGEGYGSPPGDIRAYDIRTGDLAWSFRTIPIPGDYGYETYENPDAWQYVGGANNWGEMTVDEANGIVFVPTGSPTHDLYGADRVGDNLFGNTLLALNARTGERIWHFQTIHHDLWDYDLAAAPKLLTVTHEGRRVDIVAQAGKTGFLYVFHRLTGEPLWPIEDRPVPRSEVPGEVSSPTQPFPTRPPPFSRQVFTPDDVNPFIPLAEQEDLREAVRNAANEGVFTPSSHLRYHIQMPGAWGGANWGSTAADPETGMMFVRSLEMPSYRRMSPRASIAPVVPEGRQEQQGLAIYSQACAVCHGPGQIPMRSPDLLGTETFRAIVRGGASQMPAFNEEVLPPEQLAAVEAYLRSLSAGSGGEAAGQLQLPVPTDDQGRYRGPPIQYTGSFSAGWYTSNGLPAIGPPWTQLVAYDLNEGTIRWRVPDGNAPGLADLGIMNTGTVRPRNGPVVTAGGLVFVANSQDRMARAFDKLTGEVLWEYDLGANPEGMPAVYEVGGRQFVVFGAGASMGTGGDPIWRNPFHRRQGSLDAQGYHAFALPD